MITRRVPFTLALLALLGFWAAVWVAPSEAATATYSGQPAKYVFFFIGDGMGMPQRSAAEFYAAAKAGKISDITLAIDKLPVQGMTTTYSSESPITDSAAAGTAMACGVKTYNAALGMDANKNPYTSIAEMARDKGMLVGIVSSVSIDHATPASFYAHQPSRNTMYEIGLDLVASKFDYFGGGGFVDPSGKKSKLPEPRENVLDAAKKAGYTVAADKASFEKLAKGVKAIAYNAWLQDAEALPYDIDTRKEDISLAEFTAKGIELLDNPKGFFMMVEGGKIDWACHANDALTSIKDTQAFDESMKVALAFMAKHPKETVIVVTGDHECGGLTIGFAGTKYENFFTVLDGQKVSFQKFSAEILKEYKEKNAGKYNFDDMKPIITANFGLKFEGDAKADRAVLKDFEIAQLKEAFERSMAGDTEKSKDEQTYLLYGGYSPLTVTITHILNQKAGLAWTSYSHTGVPVATSADGVGAEIFGGLYDNTDLALKFMSVMGLPAKAVPLTKSVAQN